MFGLQKIPLERHVPRQIRLERHVRLQQIPLERHVPRADPVSATCSAPADPARATCSRSSREKKEFGRSALDRARHVRLQPNPAAGSDGGHLPRDMFPGRETPVSATTFRAAVDREVGTSASRNPPTTHFAVSRGMTTPEIRDPPASSLEERHVPPWRQIRLAMSMRHVRLSADPGIERHVPRRTIWLGVMNELKARGVRAC